MLLLCILVTPELLYSCLCTVIIRCAFVARYYDVLFVHVLLSWSIVPVFRHVLLWWWQVIVLSFRWCCIPDLHGHCSTDMVLILLDYDSILTWWFLLRRSWILNTWVLIYTDDYIERCLDDIMMISTTTADYGLYYRTCQLRRSLLHDVVVMSSSTSLLMLSSFAVPPGDVVVVVVLICSVCAPVQLRADEYLLYRWWVSRLQPLTPYELVKQFVSARWTLEDDLMILLLHCRTWLNFVYCIDCILVSEHPVCLCVCHPVHCRTADVVFTQHLSL